MRPAAPDLVDHRGEPAGLRPTSGTVAGSFTFSNGNQTVTLTPGHRFALGEVVSVNLAETITAADASPLRGAGYAFQFGILAGPAQLSFAEIDVLDVRTTPGVTTRA